MTSKPAFAAPLFVLLAGSTWGLTGLCNRMLAPFGLEGPQIAFARCFFSVLAMGLFLLLTHREAFRIKLRDLWCFLGTGVLSFSLLSFSYLSAQSLMSLSAAVVMMYTAPVYVILLSAPLFHERITGRKLIALAAVLAGALLTTGVLGGQLQISALGLMYGVLSGFAYAMYSIFSRFAIDRGYGSYTITFYTFLFGMLALGLITDIPSVAVCALQPKALFWMLFIGVVCSMVPYIFYTLGLQGMENGPASVIATVEMVVATLVGVVLFHEQLTVGNVIGILLVFGGIAIINLGGKKGGESDVPGKPDSADCTGNTTANE